MRRIEHAASGIAGKQTGPPQWLRFQRIDLNPEVLAAAAESRAWPFEEAKKIIERYKKTGFPETVLFETGYGPSGLPHIGTFGEVARTTMVRHAFRVLTEDKVKTRLLCFSDDMDGLRKVPDNVPNKEMLRSLSRQAADRGARPVLATNIQSSAQHNNARLRAFLDRFGFDYEFASRDRLLHVGPLRRDAAARCSSATTRSWRSCCRRSREERRRPIRRSCRSIPKTGIVMQVPIDERKRRGRHDRLARSRHRRALRDAGDRRPRQAAMEAGLGDALGGARRRLRDVRQGPDRQRQAGRADLPGARRAAARRLQLRAVPRRERPEDLEVEGQRPDHRRVADLRADREPRPLHVPEAEDRRRSSISTSSRKAVDEYYTFLAAYPRQDWKERLGNPVWHMHDGNPPVIDLPVPFALLLNLVSASNAQNKAVLWGFISRYAPGVTPADPSRTRPAGRLRDPLLRRFREAGQGLPRARRGRAQALASAVATRSPRCRPTPTARRSRTPRSTSRARSSATRTMPSRARRAGRACRSPSSR